MKLYEYEAKEIAKKYGVPVPRGEVADRLGRVFEIASALGGPVVVKSQVLVGGRGLAGGIRAASSPEEALRVASELLGRKVKGEEVKLVLVEERVCFEREYYLSITVDRSSRSIVYLASPLGGVEVEDLVREQPDKLLKVSVDPLVGYLTYQSRSVSQFLGIPRDYWGQVDSIMRAMYSIMVDYDAELVEFNPLAWKCGGGLVALDAKIIIDDNSLYKHSDLAEKRGRELSYYEARARELGFSYVELDGDVGVVANGAGLTMATMDSILLHGGRPANFLDVGGGASRDRVKEAVKLLLAHPSVRVLLVNIFGGITRCDEVALGIVEAYREARANKPIVVRLLGTNEEEGRKILVGSGFEVYSEMEDAVRKAVELASAR